MDHRDSPDSPSMGASPNRSSFLGINFRRSRTVVNRDSAVPAANAVASSSPAQIAEGFNPPRASGVHLPTSNSTSNVDVATAMDSLDTGVSNQAERMNAPRASAPFSSFRRPATANADVLLNTRRHTSSTALASSAPSDDLSVTLPTSGPSLQSRLFRRSSQGPSSRSRTSHGVDTAGDRERHVGRAERRASSRHRSARAASTPPNHPPNLQRAGAAPAESSSTGGVERSAPDGPEEARSSPVPSADGQQRPATGAEEEASHPSYRIRLVPHLEATRSLHFEPIEREVRESAPAIKIGRFTDRSAAAGAPAGGPPSSRSGPNADTSAGGSAAARAQGLSADASHLIGTGATSSAGGGGSLDSDRIAFKSKVVSRGHAEMWCETGGKFFIRDTKSSSGTFLNHIRLSPPGVESRAFAIKDGDVVQLGVDYQGGTEEIYRCVKMRVELNREWQRAANQFNMNALRQLRALGGVTTALAPSAAASAPKSKPDGGLSNKQAATVTDCCICLFPVTVCQALFIAPCSHVFHFKCIRPLLILHHPGFSCPLCRTFADLEADVEQDEGWQELLAKEAELEAAGERAAASTPPGDGGDAQHAQSLSQGVADVASSVGSSLPTSENESGSRPTMAGSSAQPLEAAGSAVEATSSPASPPRSSMPSHVNWTPRHINSSADWSDRPPTAVAATPLHGNVTHSSTDVVEEAGNEGFPSAGGGPGDEPSTSERAEGPDRTSVDVHGSSLSSPVPVAVPRASSRSINSASLADANTPSNNTFFSVLAETSLRPSALPAQVSPVADGVLSSADAGQEGDGMSRDNSDPSERDQGQSSSDSASGSLPRTHQDQLGDQLERDVVLDAEYDDEEAPGTSSGGGGGAASKLKRLTKRMQS